MTKNYPSITTLRDSFNRIYDGADNLQREYELMIESERLGISLDTYRQLYNLRREEEIEPYPKPQKWWHIPGDWGVWVWCLPLNKKIVIVRKGLFKVIQSSIIITASVALVRYVWETPKREQQAHYQAWQMVNSAKGQTSSGGRIEALQDLNKDGLDLSRLDVSKAVLTGINLQNAELTGANFYDTTIHYGNLENSNLTSATFELSYLKHTNFKGAVFGCQNDRFCTNFIGVDDITPQQIMEANGWDKACYNPSFSRKLKLKPKDPQNCTRYKKDS